MSKLYELTADCHRLIDQLREKGLNISEVDYDSDYYKYWKKIINICTNNF